MLRRRDRASALMAPSRRATGFAIASIVLWIFAPIRRKTQANAIGEEQRPWRMKRMS